MTLAIPPFKHKCVDAVVVWVASSLDMSKFDGLQRANIKAASWKDKMVNVPSLEAERRS